MKRTIILLIVLLIVSITHAQKALFSLGFKAGAAYSGISDIRGMFYPEDHFDPSTFSTREEDVWGFAGSIFMTWRPLGDDIRRFSFSIQPEVLYSMQGEKFFYEDNQDYNCEIDFKYQYISLGLLFKGDVTLGQIGKDPNILSLQAGPRMSFNLDPQNITYKSNSNRFGDDNDLTQAYRNVLKGRGDFSIGVGLSFKLGFGLGIDAMYYFGLSDVIETQVNNYDFVDNSNKSRSLQICLFYAYDFNKGNGSTKPKYRYRRK